MINDIKYIRQKYDNDDLLNRINGMVSDLGQKVQALAKQARRLTRMHAESLQDILSFLWRYLDISRVVCMCLDFWRFLELSAFVSGFLDMSGHKKSSNSHYDDVDDV